MVEARLGEEPYGRRTGRLLTADSEGDAGAYRSCLARDLACQGPDDLGVQLGEGGCGEEPEVLIGGQHMLFRVIAGQPPDQCGQVVGAQGEGVRTAGDRPGQQRGPRSLDHGAQRQARLGPCGAQPETDVVEQAPDEVQFGRRAHHGNQQLGPGVTARAAQREGGLQQRLDLYGRQHGQQDAHPHPAHAQHGVVLVQATRDVESVLVGRRAGRRRGQGESGHVGEELVTRGVEQADRDGKPVHRAEHVRDFRPQEGVHGGEVLRHVGAGPCHQDPLEHLMALAEEHVLEPAQSHSGRAERPPGGGVRARVGVHPHGDAGPRGQRGQRLVQPAGQLRGGLPLGGTLHVAAETDRPGEAVHRHPVTGMEGVAARSAQALPVAVQHAVDERGDGRQPESARHDRRVRRLSAPLGHDGRRGQQTRQILRPRLGQDEHRLLAVRLRGDGRGRAEDDGAGGDAGGHAQAARSHGQTEGLHRCRTRLLHVQGLHQRNRLCGRQPALLVPRGHGVQASGTVQRSACAPDEVRPAVFDDEFHPHRPVECSLGGADRLLQLRAPGLRVDQSGEIRAARCQQLGSGGPREIGTGHVGPAGRRITGPGDSTASVGPAPQQLSPEAELRRTRLVPGQCPDQGGHLLDGVVRQCGIGIHHGQGGAEFGPACRGEAGTGEPCQPLLTDRAHSEKGQATSLQAGKPCREEDGVIRAPDAMTGIECGDCLMDGVVSGIDRQPQC